MNILEEIANTKEYFINLKTNEDEGVDKILDIFYKIINENSEQEAHKNIGTKINKFNYEKYVNCKKGLDNIIKNSQTLSINSGMSSSLLNSKISQIKQIENEIDHKISTYEGDKKSN